jgi:hypothetical protein
VGPDDEVDDVDGPQRLERLGGRLSFFSSARSSRKASAAIRCAPGRASSGDGHLFIRFPIKITKSGTVRVVFVNSEGQRWETSQPIPV